MYMFFPFVGSYYDNCYIVKLDMNLKLDSTAFITSRKRHCIIVRILAQVHNPGFHTRI